MIRTTKQPKDHFEGQWEKGRKYTLFSIVENNGTKFRSVTPNMKAEPYVIYDSTNETFSANAGWEIVEMSEDSRLSAMGGNGGGDFVTPQDLETALSAKQDKLVSGTNIKTINGQSVLGGGDMTIQTGETDTVKYVPQTLTEGQKKQARKNIGSLHFAPSGSVPGVVNPGQYATKNEIRSFVRFVEEDAVELDNEDLQEYIQTGKGFNSVGAVIPSSTQSIIIIPVPEGSFKQLVIRGYSTFKQAYPAGTFPLYFYAGSQNAMTLLRSENYVIGDDGTTIVTIREGDKFVGFYVANTTTPYDAGSTVEVEFSGTEGMMEDEYGNPLVADDVDENDERPVKSKGVAVAIGGLREYVDESLENIGNVVTPEYPNLPNIEPDITWNEGAYLNSNGGTTNSAYCAYSGFIPVPRGAFALKMNAMKGIVSAVALWIGYTAEDASTAITGEMVFDTSAGDDYTAEVLLPILPGVPFIRLSRWSKTSYPDLPDPVISFVTLADSKAVKPGLTQLRGEMRPVPSVSFLPLAKVEIDSELLTPNASDNSISPLTTSKNEVGVDGNGDIDGSVTVKLTMADGKVIEDSISIAYQGNSTLTDPKKGLSIDTANKHRLGGWIEFDSFHLKAYWTDWMHARDLVGNKLLEQIYLSRSMETRRPFMKDNNFDPSDDRLNSDTGVRCHIDGFPVELYINGTYWGLYSWNVKKDRNNYALSKNDNQHIMVECGYDGAVNPSTGDIVWTSCEFRNPKTVKNADGTKYDGDNPQEIQDGDVKKSWVRFCTFLHSITAATTKEEVAQYIDIEDFVDYTVLADALLNSDTFRNNILWTCWDATVESDVAVSGHWHPLTYDMDLTFGKSKVFGSMYNKYFTHPWSVDVWSLWANAVTPEMVLLRQILADEISARYCELRANGIFTAVNLEGLFTAWTKAVGYDAFKREQTRWPSATERPVDSTMRCVATVASRLIALDRKYNYNK